MTSIITLGNGRLITEFKVEGTDITISVSNFRQILKVNAKTFEEKKENETFMQKLRRFKGEKFFSNWKQDVAELSKFTTEREILDSIEKEFVKERGLKLISRQDG